MYNDLGFDLLQELKSAAATGVKAARAEVLARGGAAIAATPEGQQAIQDSLVQQGKVKVQSIFGGAVPTPVLLGVAALAAFWLFRRRGR